MKAILAVVFFLANLRSILAWGAVGHEVVATIAQIHLHPSVLPTLCHILNFTSSHPDEPECYLASVAAWADKLRFKMRWSAGMHYVNSRDDYPPQTCLFPGPRGWGGSAGHNVLSAIRNDSEILQAWAADMDSHGLDLANEALKFLIHFLGDLHMPLHLTGRDRGGNGDKVLFDGRQSNLHSVWDSLLIAKSLRTIERNYTSPLPLPQIEYNLRGTIYDPYVRKIVWEGLLGRWKDELSSWLDCPTKTTKQVIAAQGRGSRLQRIFAFWRPQFSTEETDDEFLCPYHWAQPIHQLNCDIVWPKELDEPALAPRPQQPYLELDTPEYSGVISRDWIIERLLAQAGIRLAGLLNFLFADIEQDALSVALVDM